MTPARPWVTVVSGLPRSGTSLLMQMLDAAGLPAWVDDARPADVHNPRGYFEHSGVLGLLDGPEAMARALGHAVKVVYPLALRLPAGVAYRLIVMKRDLAETIASQGAMARALGAPAAGVDDARLAAFWADHLRTGLPTLRGRAEGRVLEVDFADTLRDPGATAGCVATFLDLDVRPEVMAAVVRDELYRTRRPSTAP